MIADFEIELPNSSGVASHAAQHAAAGSDPVTISESQVTGLTSDLAAKASSATVSAHISNTSNPHSVTKSQVGLGSVDNTADASKPVSSAQQAALDAKADNSSLTAHTSNTSNPHSVTKAQVGLGSVDNTADSAKPVSTAQAAADSAVASSAASALSAHASNTSNPHSVTKSQVGLGSVDNTADASKPVSTAQAAADSAVAAAAASALSTHTGNTSNPHSVTKAQVGLTNADDTSDANKPVSTPQQTALDAKADKLLTTDARSSTSETLVLGNACQRVTMDNGSVNTLTVPANADVAFAVGTQILVQQLGAGTTTIAAAGGVTILSRGGFLNLAGQYAVGVLIKDDTDIWTFTGDRA